MSDAQGINKAKNWQLLFFAANNGAVVIGYTLIIAKYYLYFSTLALNLAPLVICIIIMASRLLDGLMSPYIGSLMQKTDTKFGKFRPFMIIGNLISVIAFTIIFLTPVGMSEIMKYIFITAFNFLFIIGFTMQSAVTKCGLAIMTNDTKQRGLYGTFDSIFTGIGGGLLPLIAGTILYKKFSIFNEAGEIISNGYANPKLWITIVIIFAPISIILTLIAVYGIKDKDVKSIYGVGSIEKFKIKDFINVLKNNKAISSLVISASTDKLAYTTRTLTSAFFFIVILLNGSLDGTVMLLVGAPAFLVLVIAFRYSAKVGMKKVFVWGSWAAAILSVVTIVLVPILAPPSSTAIASVNAVIIMVIYCLQYLASFISSAIVQPMISDCTDYEFYKNNRFIPSIMGNLFAFVDKLMSAFAGLVLGAAMLFAGYGFQLNLDMPAGNSIGNSAITDSKFYYAIIFCVFIMPLLGHIATIIAMKWYPIDTKVYAEMQTYIANKRKEANEEIINGS